MTDTTNPQQADRRDRYDAAIREAEGWVLDDGQHMLDAVLAVADAEQAELRTRIAELESSCRDVDRLRKDWVEMRDRVEELDDRAKALAAVTVPASAPTDQAAIRAAALREAADFVGNDDDCGCGGCDTCLPRKLAAELRRMADAASGPGGAAGETQQDEGTTADKAAALGLTDTEYRARSHAAAVATVRAAIPGMYAHVGFRLEDVLNEGGETQQDETPADLLPAWEAMYEPGNVSDYLIGYANDEAPAKAAAEAWLRSQAEVTGRLEWVPQTPLDGYDQEAELIERHDDGIDTGPGITVRRRVEPAAVSQPDGEPSAVCVCGHSRGEHLAVSGRLLCDACDPDSTDNRTCDGFEEL